MKNLNTWANLVSSLEEDTPTDSTTYDWNHQWPSSTGFGETTYVYMTPPLEVWETSVS